MIHERNLVLCIDQGTTSTRVAVIDNNLKILMIEQIEHEQIHEYPGWTEHDPMQLYFNVNLLIDRIHLKNKDVNIIFKTISPFTKDFEPYKNHRNN